MYVFSSISIHFQVGCIGRIGGENYDCRDMVTGKLESFEWSWAGMNSNGTMT